MNGHGDERTGDPDAWKAVRRFAVLDTSGEDPGTVFPTAYVTDELLVDPGAADADVLGELQKLAAAAGWSALPDPDPAAETDDGRPRGASGSMRVRLAVAPGSETVAATPDAWSLLRRARGTDRGSCGISLHHVLTTDSLGVNPFTANPFTANPFTANPFTANPFTANPFTANAGTVGLGSYGAIGAGARQPVAYLGPEPRRRHPEAVRPIVAVFDTGCGTHPWLEHALVEPRLGTGRLIGLGPQSPAHPDHGPELEPRRDEPLDGLLDVAAGHGTFIAGIIRQECPDALILPVRVADGDGVILEDDLIQALGRLIDFMDDRVLEEERGGSRVGVLNLSFSFYHERPGDASALSELGRLLDEIRQRGCVVVCSAGNEATTRPTYPAAIPAQQPDRQVSVGALNPSDRSVALFSNIGDWVEAYAPGVAVLSTLPTGFEGGAQAGTKDDRLGRRRETLDLDDFRGGFGVWSGTSFAAPVVAGRIAEQLLTGASPEEAKEAVLRELEARDRSRTT